MHIYGYGQLENIEIMNLADFQVFFGENEAGKSTIMAFIHGILFGFPTKQQSELRYEPKHSTKYGGKIKVFQEGFGNAVIERVRGKAAGDVQVIVETGTIGGEELLKELLQSFDKSLYQAVFSFNLQGLQNIHQMKGEDLGKFLFSAGTLGTEQLSKAETHLQKELENRFKPSGRKPLLNEKLQALHQLHGELKIAESKNEDYGKLVEEKEKLQQEMEAINIRLHRVSKKVEALNEWKRIEPIVREEKWTNKELTELGDIQFPPRGIDRIEKLNQLIHPCYAEITSIGERIANLNEEIEAIEPDVAYLEQEPAIVSLLDQLPILEQIRLEKQNCETKLTEYEEKLLVIGEKLHLPLDEDEIAAINTNIYIKNQVENVSQKKRKLLEVKEELEERYQEEVKTLEELEEDVLLAEKEVLTKQERLLLEEQVNHGNGKKSIEQELKSLQDKIEFYQQENERDKAMSAKRKRQRKMQFFLFEVIFLLLILYGFFTQQWAVIALSIIGCLVIALFLLENTKQTEEEGIKEILSSLNEKERQIKEKLHSAAYLGISELENRLYQDNQKREELQMLTLKRKQQQYQYEKLLTKFEEWEMNFIQNNEKLLSLGSEIKIPKDIADAFLFEAFELIEQYKSISREKKQLLIRLKKIGNQQHKIEEGFQVYQDRFLDEKGLEIHNAAFLLRNKLKEEHEKQIKTQERLGKLDDLKADLKQKSQELELLQAERGKLLQVAKVETEQQFFALGEKAEKQQKLLEKLYHLRSQLQYSILPEKEREDFLSIHDSNEKMKEYNLETEKLHARLKSGQDELASIRYEIQVLEEGGRYADIFHLYKQKKYELEEAAKEWSVYSLAQEILKLTINKYKNVHLPRMLSKAEEYMSFLTDGSYRRIHLQKSGTGFLVERLDHTLFEANELSQATTEQLYVSIRLALATTLYEKYQFPIMIDDSFVNFDAKRTEKVMGLLREIKQNQILFFTCHHHLLQLFQKENVLNLEKAADQISR